MGPIEHSHDNRARLTRRQFVQRLASAGTMLGLTGGITCGDQAGAGAGSPGPGNRPAHLIPADKGLSPQWRQSLVERGRPEVWSGEQLRFIGMPVGGIAYGQLTVKTLAFDLAAGAKAVNVTVTLDRQPVDTAFTQRGDRVVITLEKPVTIAASHRLDVTLR